MRTTEALIRLCATWFESSLGAHIRRYIFLRCGSYAHQWYRFQTVTNVLPIWSDEKPCKLRVSIFLIFFFFLSRAMLYPPKPNLFMLTSRLKVWHSGDVPAFSTALNIYKTPFNTFRIAADSTVVVYFFFFFLKKKKSLTRYVHHLQRRRFTWNIKPDFLGK